MQTSTIRTGAALAFCLFLFSSIGLQAANVIVGFRGPTSESLIASKQGQVSAKLKLANALVVDIPSDQIAALRKDPRVAFVEPDGEMTTLEVKTSVQAFASGGGQPAQSTPWGVTKIGATSVNIKTPLATQQVPVAVIDTGIYYTHPDLIGNVNMGATYVAGSGDSTDDHGHGTHVAGTVAAVNNTIGVLGVAPKAQVWGVKVLDSSGSGSYSNIALGIDWAAANAMKVINMSLGGPLDSAAVRTSCSNANAAGILIVAAAGNEGAKKLSFPGGYVTVMCVSAVDNKNALASFSSYGNQVDICAPGVNVLSTIPEDWYAYFDGTSMASPHVAGTAALVWGANPRFSRSDVRTRIQNKATNLGPAGWDNKFGYGLVNALKAVNP